MDPAKKKFLSNLHPMPIIALGGFAVYRLFARIWQ
jgi:hypothetical protein